MSEDLHVKQPLRFILHAYISENGQQHVETPRYETMRSIYFGRPGNCYFAVCRVKDKYWLVDLLDLRSALTAGSKPRYYVNAHRVFDTLDAAMVAGSLIAQ